MTRWGALPAGLSRAALLSEVGASLAEVPHGAGVLLAVSGGPDSTALAYLVTEVRPDLRATVAHVRHGLRDDRRDAETARAHAAALDLPYAEREIQVRSSGEGVEAAAREARYAALARLARRCDTRCILLGHTADDQAETVLLNLARGSGVRGLAGMSRVRAEGELRLLRPLLRVRRADVRAFVAQEGLEAVADPTNTDPRQRRYRARADVLPLLATLSGGPGDPVGVLTRLADLARADADALDELAAAHARRLVMAWGPVRAAPAEGLRALPVALAARVVRLLLASVRGSAAQPSAEAVGAVLDLRPGQALDVAGGVWVTAGGGWLAAAPADLRPLERRLLAVPGVTPLPELGLCLRADQPWGAGAAQRGQGRLDLGTVAIPALREAAAAPPEPLAPPPPWAGARLGAWTVLPEDAGTELAVRARRPGERLRLASASRKLQDLFTDHGVPRAARELVPVIVDAHDEPLWVPGVARRWWPPTASAGVRLWLAPADDALYPPTA